MLYTVTKLYPDGRRSAGASIDSGTLRSAKAVASRFAGRVCDSIVLELREHNTGAIVAVRVKGQWQAPDLVL